MNPKNNPRKAVVLLSGGIDSVTALEIARKQGFEIHALSFSYGQRHQIELQAVQKILKGSPVHSHRVVQIDLRSFGGSALTSDLSVPKTKEFHGLSEGVPITYVPARNTIFLSFALGFAETIGAFDIFIGVNGLDAQNYPDCRPEFISAFENVANCATAITARENQKFNIHAPLIQMTKGEVIRTGLSLGVNYSVTTSCYDPSPEGISCGQCDACHLRIQGFRENGLVDPAI